MMHIRTIIFSAAAVLAAFGPPFFLTGNFSVTAQSSVEEERAQLEAQLKELEAEIAVIESDITKTQQEKDTLTNRIAILKSQIRRLDLQIEQSNILIGDLRLQIADTSSSIERISGEIETTKEQMAEVLRYVYQENQRSQVEILLASATVSDFFTNMAALASLNVRLDELLSNMVELHDSLSKQHVALESEKEEEERFVEIQLLQKQESQGFQAQTQELLQQTQGKEAEYQRLLADTQKRAQEIRSRIFELIGVPEAPTFGEAVEIAKWAGGQAGVRAELLLAVLTQESNLGENVGSCYLKNSSTGESVSMKSGKVFSNGMKPSRDVSPFMEITKEIGRDPYSTPVSCPQAGVGGWGGAMGPSQFIPSTWQLFKERIASIAGKLIPNPWDPKDAIIASSIYLGDLGADSRSYSVERNAACRYYSGKNCNQSKWASIYGNQVMAKAQNIQETMIDILQGS